MSPTLNELSIIEARDAIQEGSITSEALVQTCLDRIHERENIVRAWIHINEEEGLKQARELDQIPAKGPLHGIPVGVKDILDTCDMPTGYGSPIYEGHQPVGDSGCVAMLREAGAVILGKTVTTEFAWRKPGKTTNPHNSKFTPGGSSSGSAAAVADFMVPLAIGTQTGGSIIRPASFCGVVGFKPTFGQLSMAGVKPLSQSLDTLGCFVRSAEDLQEFRNAIWNIDKEGSSRIDLPKVGFCCTPEWEKAGPSTRKALEHVRESWTSQGVEITEIQLPKEFSSLGKAHGCIMVYEARQNLQHELRNHSSLLSERLKAYFDKPISYSEYQEALERTVVCRSKIQEVFKSFDLLFAASAPDEAPQGLDYTGDTVFNRMWTMLHLPTLTLPSILGANQLPVGVQLVGAYGSDDHLIEYATKLEKMINSG
jgi:amidase